jgi:hypothetical protein
MDNLFNHFSFVPLADSSDHRERIHGFRSGQRSDVASRIAFGLKLERFFQPMPTVS